MASVHSSLETHLATQLLYGFTGPLNMLNLELCVAKTKEEKIRVITKLMEKHLSKDGKPAVVTLQDEKIQDLFDTAMKNMAADTVQNSLQISETVQSTLQSLASLANTLQRMKSKTWTEKTVDTVHYGLTKVGITSAKPPKDPNEVDVVLIEDCAEDETSATEESESWYEIEKTDNYNERVFAILRKWKEQPSLLLEIEPTKELMGTLKSALSPLPK